MKIDTTKITQSDQKLNQSGYVKYFVKIKVPNVGLTLLLFYALATMIAGKSFSTATAVAFKSSFAAAAVGSKSNSTAAETVAAKNISTATVEAEKSNSTLRNKEHSIKFALEESTNVQSSELTNVSIHETYKREILPPEGNKPAREYKIANFEFHRVETPFIIGIWIFFASLAKIGFHMSPRLNQEVPESCLLIVVGVAIGLILLLLNHIHISPLTPDAFFLYMLPPIIFDAGYFMPNRLFFDNLGSILMFAVVGTIFNTITIGCSLWLLSKMNIFGCDIPLLEIFIFSTLISAVDPVAVLAVFEEIHVNEILYIVVFGESLLNDAVTVVLYHMFEAYNEMGLSNILYTDLLSGIASFIVVALGGTIIGILWGFLTGFVTRFTHQVRVIEPILIFVMAYIAYLNAEMFHMSGILSITFCGITMKNYVEPNISHKSHTTVKYTMKMLSSSSETIIFMFLGISTVSEKHRWNTMFVICTILFCTIYRIIGVVILTSIVNRFRLLKLNTVDKFVMSYGGLRGAVAFALALLINSEHVKHKSEFVTTTIAVVYFTVFIQGITIRPLVKILNVKTAERRKPTMNERIHERFMDHMMAGIEDIIGHHGNHHLRDKFKRFDNNFIRPYLLRNHQGAEPKILETYSKLAMKDAMEFMRRNASTIGNISNTESVSAIFRNYTAGNLRTSSGCSQLDNSTWNIDLQELEYNPSKKDLTDAKIHHLLEEELCQPSRRHRRLSYSRHAVDDRDLSTQVNYRTHMNTRRIVGDQHKHHHRRSKKINKDGKSNHVSFPGIQQNGGTSQFSPDYCDDIEDKQNYYEDQSTSDDWENGITFTVPPSPDKDYTFTLTKNDSPSSFLDHVSQSELDGYSKSYYKSTLEEKSVITPTIAEISLPWRRRGSEPPPPEISTTQTAIENKFPWQRSEEELDIQRGTVKQNEFPLWSVNKDYMPYNSPSTTFLGAIEKPKITSVIGLFRKSSSRNNILNLEESEESLYASATCSGPSDKKTSLSRSFLSPLVNRNERNYALRRGSMVELNSSLNSIPEKDLLMVTLGNADGTSRRIRSGSVCLPQRRDRSFSVARKSSSSSSSSSGNSTFG